MQKTVYFNNWKLLRKKFKLPKQMEINDMQQRKEGWPSGGYRGG